MTTTYVTKQFDRLDKICGQVYGSANGRIVEQVLDKTPGLEAYGFLLPAGVVITLPDLPSSVTVPVIQQIKLWD